jgi:putative ABC transport system permease protein
VTTASAMFRAGVRRNRPRLPARELLGTAIQAFRTRRLRAALSALGIAIGIGAMVAVVGIAASAQANLLAEIDALGTNLLTVTPGQNFLGDDEVLPATSAILAILGGVAGLSLGASATWIYSSTKHEPFIVPLYALIAAPAAGLSIGAVAGLYPAIKAARLSPTEALRGE